MPKVKKLSEKAHFAGFRKHVIPAMGYRWHGKLTLPRLR